MSIVGSVLVGKRDVHECLSCPTLDMPKTVRRAAKPADGLNLTPLVILRRPGYVGEPRHFHDDSAILCTARKRQAVAKEVQHYRAFLLANDEWRLAAVD